MSGDYFLASMLGIIRCALDSVDFKQGGHGGLNRIGPIARAGSGLADHS